MNSSRSKAASSRVQQRGRYYVMTARKYGAPGCTDNFFILPKLDRKALVYRVWPASGILHSLWSS